MALSKSLGSLLASGCPIIPSVVWFQAQTQPNGSVWVVSMPLATRDAPWSAVRIANPWPDASYWRTRGRRRMVLSGSGRGWFRHADIAALSLSYLAECLAIARAEGAVLSDVSNGG